MSSLPPSSEAYAGGCLCGAIRYRSSSGPVNERVCHCRRCQRVIGAPFNARLLFAATELHVDGDPQWHQIAPPLEVGSCRACGSTLFMRRAAVSTISVLAGSLDLPELFRPTMHVYTASMQPWLRLDDGLPQHPGAAPA